MIVRFVKTSPCQNTTVLVRSFTSAECYRDMARKLMRSPEYLCAEQVGFLVPPFDRASVIRLDMAGGEFCGNAVLSAAAYVTYKGISTCRAFQIEASGIPSPVVCWAEARERFLFIAGCEVPGPLSLKPFSAEIDGKEIRGDLVEVESISHLVFEGLPDDRQFDSILDLVISATGAKAAGAVAYTKTGHHVYQIKPYVYVKDTCTRVLESGCGSGSLALGFHLRERFGIAGRLPVYQPGGFIDVETGDSNRISTEVRVVCEGEAFLG